MQDLLDLRTRPEGRAALRQDWLSLSFVHWQLEPAIVQSKLPSGLEVDTFEGAAYLGLVPFTMSGVRPVGMPAIPGMGAFHEWNLRTYVRHQGGGPGVWFFSLEASNWPAVVAARAWYRLPYHFAHMSMALGPSSCGYASGRRGIGYRHDHSEVAVEFTGDPRPSQPGTLEFWLVERYQLYARSGSRLFSGRVWHPPYNVHPARLVHMEESVTAHEAFVGLGRPISTVLFSPGVSVEVFPLRVCD